MATRFEIVMHGPEPSRMRSAGEEAIAHIERLDRQLSAYNPQSDISWINAHASAAPVKTDPVLFGLLKLALQVGKLTDGAFDISVAPLLRTWGFTTGRPAVPSREDIRAALEAVGPDKIILDESGFTVRFARSGVRLDLGAVGKGCAIEQAVEILREGGVGSAIVHGGTSTIHAVGAPPGRDSWKVAVRGLQPVELRDSSLSVSAVHGKSFTFEGTEFGHVIDPRNGTPVRQTRIAVVTGPGAALCDMLSTALLVLGTEWLPTLEQRFPGYSGVCTNAVQA